MESKSCTKCGEIKPLEEFNKDPYCKGGYGYKCKRCHSKRSMERRNDPKVLEYYRENARKRSRLAHVKAARRKPPRPGFIYIFQCDRFYKIGKSNDVERRLSEMNQILPFDILLIHKIDTNDSTQAESVLHDKFSDCRYKGEWFELTAHEISWLLSIPTLNFANKKGEQ